MAAAPKQMEKIVQDNERIARLESDVEHIQSDVTDLRSAVRKLEEKVDAFRTQVETRFAQLEGQINVRFAELKTSRVMDRVWWLLGIGTVLGVMARGFHWI